MMRYSTESALSPKNKARISMGVLSDKEITKLMSATPALLEHLVDKSIQLQPAGVDLTLRDIFGFTTAGTIDFSNKQRVISKSRRISFKGGFALLKQGAYKVVYNEVVHIPHDCIALAFPRSSLLRCGAFLHCAVWDPGYSGRSESLLIVSNPHGIKLAKNARLAQLVFIKLSKKPGSQYRGRYLAENTR
jgi:dUTP pyrophosphatase